MTQTPDTEKIATEQRSGAAERRATISLQAADRLGLSGPEGSRRRGMLLRRLLAMSDWTALIVTLLAVTATTPSTDVADLFWAVLFSPSWIIVVKLHGLYDHDHRRIRHSTLDEVPSLVSATVLGTLVLDALLAISPVGPLSPKSAIALGIGTLVGSFVLRGVLRWVWHRATPRSLGSVVGPPATVDTVARRVVTHPETRLHLVGYLSNSTEEDSAELVRLGTLADISEVAAIAGIERVVVTEQQMSEPAAEHLIEECKELGLALTFLPQHYGLLGPGIELNRLAELPVLAFRFSAPPRSTQAMKRAMDVFFSALVLALVSPILVLAGLAILIDSGRPESIRQKRAGKDGESFTMLKFRTMVADAEDRLAELIDLSKLDAPAFKIPDDPRVTRGGRFLRRTS